MSKQEESYEDQIQREFNQSQEGQNEPVKSIGRVKLERKRESDPNIDRINDMIGYHDVPLECLPSGGRYYPENTRISIRAARVGEIREFSTIDEDNMKDVTDKLTYIISQCCKGYYGNVLGNYKDIITADRIVLILKIRELTFVGGSSLIKVPVPSGACKTVGCIPQQSVDFCSNNLSFVEPSPELEKYYDIVNRCYNITTKSFGVITLYPPNIGVTSAIMDWIVKEQKEKHKVDASLAEILQFVIKDWRGLSEKAIFSKLTELSGWSTEKFTLVYRLIEKVNVGVEFNIKTQCQSCGGDLEIPITFPDGYKSLFVPTISDIGDELL